MYVTSTENFKSKNFPNRKVAKVFFHHSLDFSMEKYVDISSIPRNIGFVWIALSNKKAILVFLSSFNPKSALVAHN